MRPNTAKPGSPKAEIVLRVPRTRKAAYTRFANRVQGQTLEAWMTSVCDAASGYVAPGEKPPE